MKLSSYIHGICLKLSLLLAAGSLLPGCDSLIYDGEGDCKVTYRVRFRYDRNLKFADAFASEVESVTLCLFDEQGRIVWRKTERGEALKAEGYAMEVDVVPGTYDLVAWCGSTDKNSFAIPDGPARKQEWTATLNRDRASGGAFVSEDLDRLYHGYLPAQLFAKAEEGVFTYTMPLTKDTNNVRVVLQQLSGEAMDMTVSSSGSRPRTAAWTGTTDCCPTSWSPITPGTSSRERPASTCPTCPARSPR